MEDRNIKMLVEMGEMLSIKGGKAPSLQKGYEVVQNALFIISIYPGPSYKMVLLSDKWIKRQKNGALNTWANTACYTHTCAHVKRHTRTHKESC